MLSIGILANQVIDSIQSLDPTKLPLYDHAESLISKRDASQADGPGLVFPILVLVNVIVFFPLLLFLTYTLSQLIPVLAIAEAEPDLDVPPAYEATPLKYDTKDDEVPSSEAFAPLPRQEPVTASLRGTCRHLRSIRGWSSLFRGLRWAMVTGLVVALSTAALGLFMPLSVAGFFGTLIATPYATAWVHSVIAVPGSNIGVWRLRHLKATYKAVLVPTMVYTVANGVSILAPAMLLNRVGAHGESTAPSGWQFAAVSLRLLLAIGLVIPSMVVLVRVQSSLLPADTQTIVPVHRLQDQGYLSMREAWHSFSRASWVRLVKLMCRLFIVAVAFELAAGVVILLELGLVQLIGDARK
ncbi:hypothetical protein F5Y15DRAFT_351142 [Xylariaceae sp. FL0016]|nr:hypothetical protein F5Y15DRAFT_351142 [Xylariaceae sp. FL0016]